MGMMSDFLEWILGTERKERAGARAIFERAVALDGDSREKRATRIRAALRTKAVLDKIFLEGSRTTAIHAEDDMIAAAGGEETSTSKVLNESLCFQTVKSLNGVTLAYVPFHYAEKMFELGSLYEREEISAKVAVAKALEIGNRLADELCLDLYLVQPIEPLAFLREKIELEEAAAAQAEKVRSTKTKSSTQDAEEEDVDDYAMALERRRQNLAATEAHKW